MGPQEESTAAALSYFCDELDLPGPLPTLDEIEAAEITLPCIWPPARKRIVVVRGLFVVKYGLSPWVDRNEGNALRVLSGIPTIPKLYAMYCCGDKHFLVMQFLPGKSLDSLWRQMSEPEKIAITQQLRTTFARVRRLTPPSPPVFGSVGGGPVPHRFFKINTSNPAITGPFADESAFHNALALRSQQDQTGASTPQYTSDFLTRHLTTTMGLHACVLTHGDLQLQNILVVEESSSCQTHTRSNGLAAPSRRFVVSGVVDWEGAGWMPSYWEYASMFMTADWSDDWIIKLEGVVDACPSEAALLTFVRQSFDGF